MTLIDLVRKAKENNYNYIAINADNAVWGYNTIPTPSTHYGEGRAIYGTYMLLGHYKPPCDWQNTLIEVSQVKCK